MEPAMTRMLASLSVLLCLLAACTASSVTIAETAQSDQQGPEQPIPQEPPAATIEIAEPTPEILTPDDQEEPEQQAPEPTATESAALTPEPTAALEPGSVEVLLLDAGAEPRVELRLMIAASCGEVTTAEQVQTIAQTIDGTPGPVLGPFGTIISMRTSATPVGENYEIRSEIIGATAAPGRPPAEAAALNAELSTTVGLTIYATITDRGIQVPGTVRVEGAEALGVLGATVETLAQTQAPVPAQAVGVGATWRTTNVVDFQGVDLATISESEIVSIDGTVIELRVTAYQEVEIGSEIDLQGIPAEITQWESATVGSTTIDLVTISPIRMRADVEGRQGFEIPESLGGGRLDQDISSSITLASEPDEGCVGRATRP